MNAPGDADPVSTVEHLTQAGTPQGDRIFRNRRVLYGATTLVLTLILGLAVLGALSGVDVYGVDTAWASDEGGGYGLDVRYATVSRPALATPFEITVTRAGGFDGPVTVAVDRSYLSMWDENGFYPTPSAETTSDGWLLWEFDAPEGDALVFAYDARIEPAAQRGSHGRVAVLEDGNAVVEVAFRTRVMP